MKRQQVVNRALSAVGHGTKYGLGQGGMRPYRTVPWDDEQEVDCSGFAMWAWGLSRFQTPTWYDTTVIVSDARSVLDEGLFSTAEWFEARPGDGLAWPDRYDTAEKRHQGHVGIVVESDARGPLKVCHASAGNWKAHSDAIQVTGPEIFKAARAIVVRLRSIED